MNVNISRRWFIQSMLASGLILAGCQRQSHQSASEKQDLISRFGLKSGRHHFKRLYAAGPPAEVLLYALAPERMVGWTMRKSAEALTFLSAESRHWPILGGINGRGSTVSFETLIQKNVDLIVDSGVRNQTYLSTAARVSEQLHMPYLLIDGQLKSSVQQIQQLGDLLASAHTEALAGLAQHALDFAAATSARLNRTVRVYYGCGADGLETGMKNAIHVDVMNLLGVHNVADALGEGALAKVSIEQIWQWEPEIILTQNTQFYHDVQIKPAWKNVPAVRHHAVYLLPKLPFGWLDGPPGINRLLGVYALAPILQNQQRNRYLAEIKTLYAALYHHALTNQQIQLLGLG